MSRVFLKNANDIGGTALSINVTRLGDATYTTNSAVEVQMSSSEAPQWRSGGVEEVFSLISQ